MAEEKDDFGSFDAEKEKGANSVVPEGEYRLVVENLEMKKTKNGVYEQAVATHQILAGEFINRKLFERYNIRCLKGSMTDKQKTAVAIGRKQFGDLCKSVEIKQPKTCKDLIGKCFVGKVIIDKAGENDDYGDQNRIKKYMPANTPIAQAPTAAPGAAGNWNS